MSLDNSWFLFSANNASESTGDPTYSSLDSLSKSFIIDDANSCSFSSFRSLQNCRSLDYFGGKFVIAHRCLVPKIERYDLTFLVGGLDQPKSDLVSTIYVDYVAAEYPFKDLAFCQDVALVKYRS